MTPLVRLWIWFSAFASLAGWMLSALGQLNRAGYAATFVVLSVFIFIRRNDWGFTPAKSFSRAKKILRRFRRPLPICFAALAFLIFLGGVIYPPDNYTGLTYRVGRVLQWLSHGGWFWIHTTDYRMNDRACGMEWLSAPVLIFTNSTRGLFLLNFLPFLLLPGLIFSIFTQLGVRARVAWQWMWLLPTGYNFLLQAGSIANDTFPTIYALAAIDFALRAKKSKNISDVSHSILAAALLTGAKASNLPLLLPWAIAIFPALPQLRKKITAAALVVVIAAAVSFLPTAILNVHFLGDWSGLSAERSGMAMKNPAVGLWGNPLLLLINNFTPPFFPLAGWWNHNALAVAPHFLAAPLEANFEPGFQMLWELPTEDWSGIGFGVSLLLAISVMANLFVRNSRWPSAFGTRHLALLLFAPWISLLAYCMKSGMVTPARLISPYYPLLLPLLIVGVGQSQIVRRIWWRVLVAIVLILALAVLVATPDRPLWPAKTILNRLATERPDSHLISRALKTYSVYAGRADSLADVRKLLPRRISRVGFIGAEDDCDISLWLPLGSRRVEHFLLTDPPEIIRQANVEYVVVSGLNLQLRGVTLDDWLKQSGAELTGTTNATLKVSEGPQSWYVVRLKLKPTP
jgi:hypothetical protein